MNSLEIIKLLTYLPKRYTIGVFPSNRIPKIWRKPAAFVLNNQPDYLSGQHWLSIHLSPDGVGTYFDSYGLPPHNKDHLISFRKNCKSLVWNSTLLQSDTSKVCGHYCIMFLDYLSKGHSLQTFLKQFSKDLKKNDKTASSYVYKMRRTKRAKILKKNNNVSAGSHHSLTDGYGGLYRNSKVQHCCCKSYLQKKMALSAFRFEQRRLETFNKNWNYSIVEAEKLAAAGFYFTNVQDQCKCFECGICIMSWKNTDDPETEHRRWSPRCRFVKKYMCGNVPINPAAEQEYAAEVYDTCGPYKRNESFPSAMCPQYATAEMRLASFEEWPPAMPIKKLDLAEAGFFYTRIGDKVACFHCYGGLKNWSSGEIPWESHAKFFPGCKFLITSKSTDFVNNCAFPENLSAKVNFDRICIYCRSQEIDVMSKPCNHSMMCRSCSRRVFSCLKCRTFYGTLANL